jgi:hypothetical protein
LTPKSSGHMSGITTISAVIKNMYWPPVFQMPFQGICCST